MMPVDHNVLPVYFDILREERVPRYLVAKSIPAVFHEDDSLEELWSVHDSLLEEYRTELRDPPGSAPSAVDTNLVDLKAFIARRLLESCCFCERRCNVNRLQKETGYCTTTAVSRYCSEFLHFGEEPELVPSHTIFFSGCTMGCVYCQNWDISTSARSGAPVMPELICEIIARRSLEGARNVNFVGGDPTSHLHTVLDILKFCNISTPMIWNSNMYCSQETMKLLHGVVDVYLGDFRYGDDDCARGLSGADRYWETVTRNFLHADGQCEILMRHLVLPAHLECCTSSVVEWVAENMPSVRFNLMFQYRPCFQAHKYPEINRSLTHAERSRAIEIVKSNGLQNVLV